MTYPVKKESDKGIFTAVMDLDNTLAEDTWPDNTIGDPIERGIEILLHLREQGNEIVVYTARPESHKPAIWAWLKAQGLGSTVYDVVCGKPRGWVLVDDRAWNPYGQEGGVPRDVQIEDAPAPRAEAASHGSRIGTGKAEPPPRHRPKPGYDDDPWQVVG